MTQLDETSGAAHGRASHPAEAGNPTFASIPKERATGGRISPSVACADGRVAARRFGRGPGHLSVIGAWSKAEAVRDGPPKPAPGASSSLPPAPGTAAPRGTGSAVIRGSSQVLQRSAAARRGVGTPTAFGSPIGKECRAVLLTDSEEELPEDLPFLPAAASSDRVAAMLRRESQTREPGGARWGPSPGRSRQPHIALSPPKGTGYGRRSITVSHAPIGSIAGRPGARGRRHEEIENLDFPAALERVRIESSSNEGRTKVERRREERREDGDPFADLPPRGRRNRAPGKLRSANRREEWRTVGPPPRAVARQPHIALASPEGTGYGSGNRTVSRAPPGSIAGRRAAPASRSAEEVTHGGARNNPT